MRSSLFFFGSFIVRRGLARELTFLMSYLKLEGKLVRKGDSVTNRHVRRGP
jgi:hypothetical protein